MKREKSTPVLSVELKRQDWAMTLDGVCVLKCVLTRPELTGTWKGIKAINRYYDHAAEIWRRRWERELYYRACLDFADRGAQGRPFREWKAELATQITRQEEGVLSLWQEGRERFGYEKTLLLRRGDTWSLEDGTPLPLTHFYPKQHRWRRRVLEQLRIQAEERLKSGESLLDADCGHRLHRAFDPERFYLTQEGIQVFFPMYTVASGGEGIPVFSITQSQQ